MPRSVTRDDIVLLAVQANCPGITSEKSAPFMPDDNVRWDYRTLKKIHGSYTLLGSEWDMASGGAAVSFCTLGYVVAPRWLDLVALPPRTPPVLWLFLQKSAPPNLSSPYDKDSWVQKIAHRMFG